MILVFKGEILKNRCLIFKKISWNFKWFNKICLFFLCRSRNEVFVERKIVIGKKVDFELENFMCFLKIDRLICLSK